MVKMILDTCLAAVLSVVLSPVFLLILLLLLLVERQSPFFFQSRIGVGKNEFKVYKFRTMIDQKITPLGKILRRTGTDELPQLFNILRAQMSFVGPRPLTASDIERLGWNSAYYASRWSVRPGIVGPAQLAPVCHKKMSWFCDRLYVRKHSTGLDFKLLLIAAAIPILGKQRVKRWIHGKR